MATSDRTASSVPESLAPAAVAPSATLPAVDKTPLAPTPALQDRRWPKPGPALSTVLTGLVLLFAFFVASTAVRNSDAWRHLAAGRLLAQGHYQFGVDPFTYTSAGEYWVNHAWLFDLRSYAAYQTWGGAAV